MPKYGASALCIFFQSCGSSSAAYLRDRDVVYISLRNFSLTCSSQGINLDLFTSLITSHAELLVLALVDFSGMRKQIVGGRAEAKPFRQGVVC